jgi:UDP-N-acetylmuramoyl-L-alanyl-D-glutamate--2,6-diaminopimelate ligase
MEKILRFIKKLIPKGLFSFVQPIYHYSLAFFGAVIYRFPSKKIKVVAVTGTKGKTSTVEFVNSILETAGFKTALAGTLRFKIGDDSKPNLFKMTMPGRFFIQKFLRNAVNAKCDYAVIEISSEASKQYRHKFIDLDALIFTNLAPEHIESHGGFEQYREAKLNIARALQNSCKKEKIIISNIDDLEGQKFLDIKVDKNISYSFSETSDVSLSDTGVSFSYKNTSFKSKLIGKFNIYNMLGAIKFAETQKIGLEICQKGIERLDEIKGRVQKIIIEAPNKQGFDVVVDYAHTPDSLEALYTAFKDSKKICVLGNCGGGRDKWKRKEMALIAEKYCDEIILTDEDPYDDNPREIVEDMVCEMTKKKPEIVMDRREAIALAIKKAQDIVRVIPQKVSVLITGKGTDPYIMRANGQKEKWSDAEVAREELEKSIRS